MRKKLLTAGIFASLSAVLTVVYKAIRSSKSEYFVEFI